MFQDEIIHRIFEETSASKPENHLRAFENRLRQSVSQMIQQGLYSHDEFEKALKGWCKQYFVTPTIIFESENDDGIEPDFVALNAQLNALQFDLQGWLDNERYQKLRSSSFVRNLFESSFPLKGQTADWVFWNAAHILSRCNDPIQWQSNNKNGLVYGMVQSGKTASMLALSALAFETGFDIVLVLTSRSVALRQQTQNRFDALFQNPELRSSIKHHRLIDSPTHQTDDPGQNMTGERFFRASKLVHGRNGRSVPSHQYLVVKKEVNILKKLVNQVKGLITTCDRYGVKPRFLILDDEADFGSLNTSKNSQSKTNDLIESLRLASQHSDYVAYTATPQGCLSADVNAEIGFPRDFIWVLEPVFPLHEDSPQLGSYTGGQELLVDFSDFTICSIPDDDWPFHEKDEGTGHQGVYADGSVLQGNLNDAEFDFLNAVISGQREFPSSLVVCLVDYAISGALRWRKHVQEIAGNMSTSMWIDTWVEKMPRHAVMIHQSRLKDHQQEGKRLIHHAWKKAKEHIENQDAIYEQRVQDFINSSRRLNRSHKCDEAFHLALQGIISVTEQGIALQDNHGNLYQSPDFVYLLNSDTEHHLNYEHGSPLETKKAAIVLGGDKLSRGLTIEGLTVSYFVRSQKESLADTVMQMARWFGHKADYLHVMRIYLQKVNIKLFQELVHEDLRLRYELKKDIFRNVSPMESSFHLRSSKLFKPSNRQKTRTLEEAFLDDFSNGAADVKWFTPKVKTIEFNAEILKKHRAKWTSGHISTKVHSNRACLYANVETSLVTDFLKELDCNHALHLGSNAIAAFLTYWKEKRTVMGDSVNVAVFEKENGQLTRRQRSGLPRGKVDPAITKVHARDEFKTIHGGSRKKEGGNYLGDRYIDFSEAAHASKSAEELKMNREKMLLLVYELDPNYVKKGIRFEPGDDRYLNTSAGIIALSLITPENATSGVRAWVNPRTSGHS